MNQKGFTNIILIAIVVAIVAIGGYFVYQKISRTPLSEIQPVRQIEPNETDIIYTVDELVKSNIKEGTEIFVRGRYNGKLINAGPDYEGPGGGNYLFGETESILLEPQEALDGVELNQIITVKGKVEYCGGKKVPRYICALSNVEFIQAVFEFKHIELSDHNWEAIGSTITIEKDGSYTVEFGSPGQMETRKGKLTTDGLGELTKIINNANVFSLNDEYTGPRKTTRSWGQYNLIIETKSGSKSVSFHSEDETVPQALHDIVNTIIELTK